VQVADWNLHERQLQPGHRVNGEPLRSFHFRGYDPKQPHLLDASIGPRPRHLLSENDALAALCEEYHSSLDAAGSAEVDIPYGWTALDDGTPIDDRMRRVFRMALKAGQRPPVPFGDGSAAAVLDWLRSPEVPSNAPRPSRYLMQVWFERADLRVVFPDPGGVHTDAFLDWARANGEREAAIPTALVPEAAPELVRTGPDQPGVNLAGYMRAVLGLGEAARAIKLGLDAASIPTAVVAASGTQNEESIDVELTAPNDASHDVTIACVTADQFAVFSSEVGPALFRDRYVIGFWFWESPQITDSMRGGIDMVDEIWVASTFCKDVFRSYTDKPVRLVPLPVIPPSSGASRAELGLPDDRFLFVNSFDYLSTFERKNPMGVLRAFVEAFTADDGPILVLKSINGDKRMQHREALRLEARRHPHVRLLDGYMSEHEQSGLMRAADCFVSLHRSEGFGLGPAYCMALGKPAIATGWSGNLTFMNEANSWLVPYEMTTVGPDALPYPAGAEWADPDLDAAAAAMHQVVEDPDEVSRRTALARRDLATSHSAERCGQMITARLGEIRRERAESAGDGLLEDRTGP
jgi:glycosyltransferase involved in cell wall biosynthesis